MPRNNGLHIIIEKGSAWSDERILGLTLREHLTESLINSGLSVSFDDESYPKCGFFAVIYDDMPLITADFLIKTVEKLEKTGKKCVKIGSGFVANGAFSQECGQIESDETLRVNDAFTLSKAFDALRARIVERHLKNGVKIFGAECVTIDASARIEAGATIESGTVISGFCSIAAGAQISASRLKNCEIGVGARIKNSTVEQSVIGAGTTVGPNAYIRGGSIVGESCRIGDFVEIKNSVLKNGVKCAHLTYVGDAEVGERVNLGCGVVFANYNGKIKQRTVVGDGAFIGSNTNLVAPLTVGANAYIAAGSTITKDVPSAAFAIARERQTVKENYSLFRE